METKPEDVLNEQGGNPGVETPEPLANQDVVEQPAWTAEHILLLRMTQPDGCLLLPGFFTRAVKCKFVLATGVQPVTVEIITECDAIIELPTAEIAMLVSQQVVMIVNWEDIPAEASAMIGGRALIMGIAWERTEFLARQKTVPR